VTSRPSLGSDATTERGVPATRTSVENRRSSPRGDRSTESGPGPRDNATGSPGRVIFQVTEPIPTSAPEAMPSFNSRAAHAASARTARTSGRVTMRAGGSATSSSTTRGFGFVCPPEVVVGPGSGVGCAFVRPGSPGALVFHSTVKASARARATDPEGQRATNTRESATASGPA
jgi:hypothetical protein